MEGLFQPMHLLIIAIVAILVFGPKKLPELGKGLGDGIRNFRDSMKQASETKPETKLADTTTQDSNTHDHVA